MEQLEQPSFTFTAPFNVEVIEVKGQSKVFLEGIISSTHLDLVNDLVTKNCLESMKKQILEKSLKLDIEHEAFRGDSVEEKEINKTKVPAGKMFDADVKAIEKNHYGLFVKSELNPFRNDYENIKGSVENGFLDSYSIAFIPTSVTRQIVEGKEVRMLDDVALLNVALTGNPINTHAANSKVFMKSIESLEEYKNAVKANPQIMNELEVKSKTSDKKKEEEEGEEDDVEKKAHYIKRTGSPGNYKYWYKDPRTGKLRAGNKPIEKPKEGLSEKEELTGKEKQRIIEDKFDELHNEWVSDMNNEMSKKENMENHKKRVEAAKKLTDKYQAKETAIENIIHGLKPEEYKKAIKEDAPTLNDKEIESIISEMESWSTKVGLKSYTQNKLQEVKQMTEEEQNETEKVEEVVQEVAEVVEEVVAPLEEVKSNELADLKAEMKSLSESNAILEKALAEMKAKLAEPVRKSTITQMDKSENFEVKSRNPLDIIA